MAGLDRVVLARHITPKAFSGATIRGSRDAAGSAAAERDLTGIVHRTIGKEPNDIATDHNGRDQKRHSGLPIHGPLVARAALRFEQARGKSVLVPVLRQEHPQGIMRAFDVGDDPAVGAVDQDEIQRHRAALVVKRGRDIGLVELPAPRMAAKILNRAGSLYPRSILSYSRSILSAMDRRYQHARIIRRGSRKISARPGGGGQAHHARAAAQALLRAG